MIRHISIKNFAIIENTSVDFHDGLNIITGETGAGKSIVIEAVSLALGSRADTAFIRSGTDKAQIQMVADYNDEEYIITREISSSGKNICKINDQIVTLGALNSLCKKLADIHGQYDHQSLLNPENHIQLVDLYKKDEINRSKMAVSTLFSQYSKLNAKLNDMKRQASKDKREHDFMAFELNELQVADLKEGEDFILEDEIALLQNSEKIFESLAKSYHIGSEDEQSALYTIRKMSDLLSETSSYSDELAELHTRVSEMYYELEDICSTARELRDKSVFSPEELDIKINRAEQLNRLKAKHNMSVKELIEYRNDLSERLSYIEDSENIIQATEVQLAEVLNKLSVACDELTSARMSSATDLEKLISSELAQLNFNEAIFSVSFNKTNSFTEDGNDAIEFLISTNKGEPLKPLSKIASGGEMSRIMLAFKKVIGDYDEIPTMIFDEIDSGISGIAASVVAKKLNEISETHQIICITHLPQIAAYGMHNYKISKHSDDNMTHTIITALNQDEKTMEIARLLGGTNITDTTIASAKELILASK